MIRNEILANIRASLNGRLSYYRAGQLQSEGFVRKLEDAFCEYFNVKYALATNSATSALHCACIATGVSKKYSAIVPVVTFSASASCVRMAGGYPVFVDIEPDTYCINPRLIKAQADHDKAIIAVHLHGHPADMDKLPQNISIIEDCSQAIGAEYKGKKVGTIGTCGVFSFNVCKPINSGEGGMLITNDEQIAKTVALVRNHGEVCSEYLGYNYRMTELQAAVLLPQFKKIDENVAQRRELAHSLTKELSESEIIPPVERDGCKHSYFTYAVKVSKNIRDNLQIRLLEQGIFFGNGGYKPLHYFDYYKKYNWGKRYPVAEDCYETVMFTDIIKPPMTVREVKIIAEKIKKCLNTIQSTS